MNNKIKIITAIFILILVFGLIIFFFKKKKQARVELQDFNLRQMIMFGKNPPEIVKSVNEEITKLLSSLEENENNPVILKQLGDKYFENKDLANAEKYYLKALKFGNDKAVLRGLATVSAANNDYESTVKYYEKIIYFSPQETSAYLSLANLYWDKMMQQNKAIEICQQAVFSDPNNLNLRLILADYYKRNGQKEEAITTYRSVLAINPDDEVAKNELNKLLILN